jgi:hypothetical protein
MAATITYGLCSMGSSDGATGAIFAGRVQASCQRQFPRTGSGNAGKVSRSGARPGANLALGAATRNPRVEEARSLLRQDLSRATPGTANQFRARIRQDVFSSRSVLWSGTGLSLHSFKGGRTAPRNFQNAFRDGATASEGVRRVPRGGMTGVVGAFSVCEAVAPPSICATGRALRVAVTG